MRCASLALAVSTVLGGNLRLQGDDALIEFSDTNGKRTALLSATCSGEPSVARMTSLASNITVELANVPHTCLNLPYGQPCVSHSSRYADAFEFYCVYVPSQGGGTPIVKGPVAASNVPIMANGLRLGLAAQLECAAPATLEVAAAVGRTIDSFTEGAELRLDVYYGASAAPAGQQLPFIGKPGTDTFRWRVDASPPTSPPPVPSSPLVGPAWHLVFRQSQSVNFDICRTSSGHGEKVPEQCSLASLCYNTAKVVDDTFPPSYNTLNSYSQLCDMESFRRADGTFFFKMDWPDCAGASGCTGPNTWKQTNNFVVGTPCTPNQVTGYEAISVPHTGYYFHGLERGNCYDGAGFADGASGCAAGMGNCDSAFSNYHFTIGCHNTNNCHADGTSGFTTVELWAYWP